MSSTDTLVDNDHITNSKADISIDNGFSFGPATRIVAVALIIFGVLALLSGGPGFFLGPLVLLAALFAVTSKHGVEISFSNNYMREYGQALGIKTGKWMSTITLPDIAVLRLAKRQGVVNPATGGMAMDRDVSANEVYILSANHRKKVLLKVCKSKNEAEEFAKMLAGKMGKNFVPFNPVVSESTKARR
jgi:hypothetical protein